MNNQSRDLVRAALRLSGATVRLLEALIRVAENDRKKRTPGRLQQITTARSDAQRRQKVTRARKSPKLL